MSFKKIAISAFVFVVLGSIIAQTSPVNAGFGDFFRQNFIVEFFQQFAQRFGWAKPEPARTGDKEQFASPSGEMMPPPPEGTPSGRPRNATPGAQIDLTKMEEERLTKLVSEGKITEDQKSAILAELASLRTKYGIGKMKEMQTVLKTWAKEHDISEEYILAPVGTGPQGGSNNQLKQGNPGGQPPPMGQGQ